MTITAAELKDNLRPLSTEQLLERRGRGGLTEIAEVVIDEILAERGVSAEHKATATAHAKVAADNEAKSRSELASLGQRFVGQLIDSAIAFAFLFAGLIASKPGASSALTFGGLVFLFYLIFADGMPNGQSWGKRLIGIKVVDARTKDPCSALQSAGRNLLLLFLGIIDWLFILGPKRQRLGDMAANTIVVRVHAASVQPTVQGPTSPPSAEPRP